MRYAPLPYKPSTYKQWTSVFIRSVQEAVKHRSDFADVERYCLFIGHGRSGHSLIGSLLNAHPEMVVSHELDALKYVRYGFRRSQLFGLILAREDVFASEGRLWMGYEYSVPNQSQGSFSRLHVIGDKKGAGTTRWLREYPWLLERLRKVVRVPIRVIHVTRNPFDNIARMNLRKQDNAPALTIERYARTYEGVASIREHLAADEILDIRYEDFLDEPAESLSSMCRFLGVVASPDYLNGCVSIVHPPSERARDLVEWSVAERDRVSRLIAQHGSLKSYSFDS